MASSKTITIGELFTDEEIALAVKLYGELNGTGRFAAACDEQVVTPALPRINQVTGQENNSRYWAYALEHMCQVNKVEVVQEASPYGVGYRFT